MRKLNIAILLTLLAVGLVYLIGCEGEEGPMGPKGDKGRKGLTGTDPELGPPAARHFAIGVTNGSRYAVNGDLEVYITFDSTVRAVRDTVVAAKLTRPPLIDGVDGEEPEWGLQKSRIRTAQLNSEYRDNEIYEIVCRAAWDEEYIYTFFQWKEREVKIPGDITVYSPSPSDQPREIYFDAQSEVPIKIEDGDTTWFDSWIRREVLDIREKCDTIIIPPLPPIIVCRPDTLFGDTNFVWLQETDEEDKLVVFWSDDEFEGWTTAAFQEYFGIPGGVTIPNGSFIDTWVWGCATSQPVNVADDWVITSIGIQPDAGNAPFMENFLEPDSVPRYQNFRDPNYRSATTLEIKLYPFWYFDAVRYFRPGWDIYKAVYAAGIVSTIPSDSRDDIYTQATFDNTSGIWTVEMRRARRTSSGDDVTF